MLPLDNIRSLRVLPPVFEAEFCASARAATELARQLIFTSLFLLAMLIVHHELLPEIYLLVLAPDPASPSELELAHHLSCAVRSGKPAVWVDCRLVDMLSPTAARLLWACHYRLQRRGAHLVLCRVSAALAQLLNQLCTGATPDLCLVDSLYEAAARLHPQPTESPQRG